MIKAEPSIVLAVVSQFRPKVSTLDAFTRHVSVRLSNLDNEGTDIILASFDDELCKDHSMVCHSAHVSWPPFRGGRRWCVYHKLIGLLV